MAAGRRTYLDWLRGVAVLLMIEAHVVDSWTAASDRDSTAYATAMIAGGMGSVLFLLLAGVAVALSAGSKLRRGGDPIAASNAVMRRGLEIFGLAFLFRLQAWILGWSHDVRHLLRVDILNIMGPSIAIAALLWRAATTARGRRIVFAAAAVAVGLLTPVLRQLSFAFLPDPVRAYFVTVPALSTFVFFPCIGFVFAGAFIGALLDDVAAEGELRVNRLLAACGVAVVAVSYAASFLPGERDIFWTSSASFFFLRVGLVMAMIAAAYAWSGPAGRASWSPIELLGRHSLFIYWIHVEMVYGLVSKPWHRALPFTQVWLAWGAFTSLMVGFAALKERVEARRAARYGAETLLDGRRMTS